MVMSVITRKEALNKIAEQAEYGEVLSETRFRDLIIAEYLRKSLCNLTFIPEQKFLVQPLYVTRLLNSVRRQLSPLWPELNIDDNFPNTLDFQTEDDAASDSFRRVLDSLETIGDAVELGNGYWLPAPIRLIQPRVQNKVLVIGGLATGDLAKVLGTHIEITGYVRYLERSALPERIIADESLWQTYEDWVGDIPDNLGEWTKKVLGEAKLCLRTSASNFDNFEVYVPSRQAGAMQFFRWVSLSNLKKSIDRPSDDLMLCRFKSNQRYNMPSNYWLGIVDFEGLKKEAPVLVPSVRRLMYGLDLLNSAPTKADWEPGGIIKLTSWLPPEEFRLLIAMGVDVSPNHGRLPLRFKFQPEWQETITHVLNKLGIDVDREENK